MSSGVQWARALFEYEGIESGDLTFGEGDMLQILEQSGDWWRGRTKDGSEGYFPFNRVELTSPPTSVPSEVTVASLKSRSKDEQVKKVFVEVREQKKNRRGQPVFNVRVNLQSGEQVMAEKTMQDFRKMDDALQLLAPGFQYVHPLPPRWADDIPVSPNQAKGRARSLTKYLAFNTKSREIFDVLIVQWASASKDNFNAMRTDGKEKVELQSGDSRDAAVASMKKALAIAYQQPSKDFAQIVEELGGSVQVAQIKYDWPQRDETEINLSKGEYVLILQKVTKYDGWWFGQKVNGKKGLFPSNYVEEFSVSEMKRRLKRGGRSRNTQNNTGELGQSQVQTSFGAITSPPPPAFNNNSGGRDRKLEVNFCVKAVEAYDELRTIGLCVEQEGRHVPYKSRGANNAAKRGEYVQLQYSAYVWDPQTQQLREISSSDKLKAPPQGISSGEAGANGLPMQFVVGKNEVIDGLEDAITQLEPNRRYRVVIAPMKGYGDVGSPPEIPGNCYLVYDLTLQSKGAGASAPPMDRRLMFSVGISRPPVQVRPQQRSVMQSYQGAGNKNRRRRKNN